MGVSVRRCLVRDHVGRGAVAESLSVVCPCACASVRLCALVCLRLCLCLPCPVPFCLRAVLIDWWLVCRPTLVLALVAWM